jgi:acetyl esterase/lipase
LAPAYAAHFFRTVTMQLRLLILVPLLMCSINQTVAGQPRAGDRPARPAPTVAGYSYGDDSPRQVFDLWQANSDSPTPLVLIIHGGGWTTADKRIWGTEHIQPFLDAGISVAATNYRLIQDAMEQGIEPPVKACLHDAARALQTIRANAEQWKIDPQRIGATGSSAGACTALWIALHKDLADPTSDDPVSRQSTRLTCVAGEIPQTSLDPDQVREWIPNAEYGGHAFGFWASGRKRPKEFELLIANRDKVLHWIKEYSPIELATKDAPPLYLSYERQKTPPVLGQREPDPTHSAIYGIKLAERLKPLGVEVVVSYPGNQDRQYGSKAKFLITKLSAAQNVE